MRTAAVLIAAGAFLAFWITLIGAEVHAGVDESGGSAFDEGGR